MSFSEKFITIQMTLAQGQFSTGNSITLSGLRMSVRLVTPGGEDKGHAEVAIFGMRLSDMNQATVLGTDLTRVNQNKITIMAGDDPNALSVVFMGNISTAFVDAQSQPDVAFRITAVAMLYDTAAKPASSTSLPGTTDVATQMQVFANTIGATFEGNSVNIKLRDRYFCGSTGQQIAALAREAGVQWIYETGTLAIWNPGTARSVQSTIISPSTGMVSYPAFTSSGIIVTTLY